MSEQPAIQPVGAQVVPMADEHDDRVLAIYAQGIAEGNATFETDVPPWPSFRADKLEDHCFVAVSAGGSTASRSRSDLDHTADVAGRLQGSVKLSQLDAG